MSTPLFRKEAIENAAVRAYGEVLLLKSPAQFWIGSLAIAVTISVILFTLLVPYSQKVQASGFIRPSLGIIAVQATVEGIAVKQFAKDGDYVHVGDPLFLLENDQSNYQFPSAHKELQDILIYKKQKIKHEIFDLNEEVAEKKVAMQDKITELQNQITEIRQQIELQKGHIKLSQEMLQRYKVLVAASAVSIAVEGEREIDVSTQKSTKLGLDRALSEKASEIGGLKDEYAIYVSEVSEKTDDLQRQISEIDAATITDSLKSQFLVRAQCDGILTGGSVDLGQVVLARQTLAQIIPRGATMEGEVYVPSQAVKTLQVGSEISVRYAAFPFENYGQFHGIVSEVAEVAIPVSELPKLADSVTSEYAGQDVSLYRVRLTLPQQKIQNGSRLISLRPGMKFEATVTTETRPIYKWVFSPIAKMIGKD
jgi:membrane fusion protein